MGKNKSINIKGGGVEKKPKTIPGTDYSTAHPCWRIGKTTNEAEWGVMSLFDKLPWEHTDCNTLSRMFFFNDVLPALRSLETQTWSEIDRATHNESRSKNHFISVDSLDKNVRKLFDDMKLEDSAEKLYSLRIGAKKRIVGIRQDNCLDILWICQDHELYPSIKKHT